jgi:hypothetical protein
VHNALLTKARLAEEVSRQSVNMAYICIYRRKPLKLHMLSLDWQFARKEEQQKLHAQLVNLTRGKVRPRNTKYFP